MDTLAEQGWVILDDFLTPEESAALKASGQSREDAGQLYRAGTGRQQGLAVRDDIRGDSVYWLDTEDTTPAEAVFLHKLDTLRQTLNQALYTGLADGEFHLAHYPPGTGYARHLDRFRDNDLRTITLVCYLNEAWQPEHGGCLRVWQDEAGETDWFDVEPLAGRAILFRSERFWHQVQSAFADRWSATGWFRRR
ncbi:2OG-Fe(II) oxygenase [Burkholderiaceae bacterium DAT-1]|nr:2OG-Fe(II) oxygenase [Burkholderiaceae bacterium DAT-1]